MRIIVRDNLDKDVTHDREWYINTDGKIFYYTGDPDGPLYIVDNDYTWEVDETYIKGYMYYTNDMKNLRTLHANSNRIAEATERIKKYHSSILGLPLWLSW